MQLGYSQGLPLLSIKSLLARSSGWGLNDNWRYKSEASLRQRLYITWVVGGVAQSLAQLAHSRGDAALKIDVGVLAPDLKLELLPGDNFTRFGQKRHQNAERLTLQPYAHPELAYFSGLEIDLEAPKRNELMALKCAHRV